MKFLRLNRANWVLVTAIIITTLLSIALDLLIWRKHFYSGIFENTEWKSWSEMLRFGRTMLCGFLIFEIWKNPVSKKDFWFLSAAFYTAIVADYFLILQHQLIIGIGFFALMQILLIIRHLQKGSWKIFRLAQVQTAILLGMLLLVLANLLLHDALASKNLSLPVAIYGGLLVGSCLASYASIFIGFLPKRNAQLAFTAMLLFVICDITVGIGAAFGDQSWGAFIRATTGLFYTPSLLLLGFSGMGK